MTEQEASTTTVPVSSSAFGVLADGTSVDRYELDNGSGMRVAVLTFGGVIQRLEVPDRTGRVDNVVLGFADLDDYVTRSPYFGALIGRYGNRIAKGRFALDGVGYRLETNEGANTLHGGPRGFDRRVWQASVRDPSVPSLELRLVSPDGDMGFPGQLDVRVTYTLSPANELVLEYLGTTSEPTVVNLTSHSYFNLAGEGSGSALEHELRIVADQYTPVDDGLLPTGELADVEGTPFDFREFHRIGSRIRDFHPQLLLGQGYDHNFALRDRFRASSGTAEMSPAAAAPHLPEPSPVATVRDPSSGRTMTISTTEPGLQFYSGNRLDGTLVGTGGRVYRQGDAFALETQHFPDSPNQPGFPSTILRPGQPYSSRTVHRFSVE